MRRLLLALPLVLVHAASDSPFPKSRPYDVTVRDQNGVPLKGAVVVSGIVTSSPSGSDGRAFLTGESNSLIVRMPGYRSAVLSVEHSIRSTYAVSLRSTPRRPSVCPSSAQFHGDKLSFANMSEVLYVSGAGGADLRVARAVYVGTGLLGWIRRWIATLSDLPAIVHGTGARWSDGFPSFADAQESREFSEELIPISSQLVYTDARGIKPDGTVWRFVGIQTESMSYEVESAGDAQELDRLLDNVCVRPDLLP